MKEKEIERLLKLLKKENRFVRVYTHMAEVPGGAEGGLRSLLSSGLVLVTKVNHSCKGQYLCLPKNGL